MSDSKARVLYTEDDPDTRELVSFLLTNSDCEVIATDSKDFALSFARTCHFDLYLIDSE
ncbi:MAG: hypothetical protein ACRD6N_12280 [Pyrinomonadaceae bacterium]